MKQLKLAEPRGICGGVRRALTLLDGIRQQQAGDIYVLHEIVHNNFVIRKLKAQGVHFVEDLAAVPDGATVVFSAHGVPPAVGQEAVRRGLRIVDATCPLVKRLPCAAVESVENGEMTILIGHRDHPEVIGVLGQRPGRIRLLEDAAGIGALPPFTGPVRVLCQTTLDTEWIGRLLALLRERYPQLIADAGVCFATGERQAAVRQLAAEVEAMIVVGSPRSSNSNRLRDIAAERVPAWLIDVPEDLAKIDLTAFRVIGLTAGASVPDELSQAVIGALAAYGFAAD